MTEEEYQKLSKYTNNGKGYQIYDNEGNLVLDCPSLAEARMYLQFLQENVE